MRKDGRHFIAYITGPSHVLLGIAFGSAPVVPSLHRESRQGGCDHGPLDEAQISRAVLEGAAKANVQLHPAEIVYVENDSPRYDLYKHCAYLLAKRVAAGEPFPEEANSAD